MPEVGAQLNQADQFATLESVKAVSECYMPTSGQVLEVNEPLKETPSQINKSPFEQGWLVKIQLNEAQKDQELAKLMNENQYKEYLKTDQH